MGDVDRVTQPGGLHREIVHTRSPASYSDDDADGRQCWVCLGREEDDEPGMAWSSPCLCRGSTKWIHKHCLRRFIDNRLALDPQSKICCPQCKTTYLVFTPKMSWLATFLDRIDQLITISCPHMTIVVILSSVYWTAVTFGACTVMQVMGTDEALAMMEKEDPMFLLLGLPAIPVLLILSRFIHWDDILFALLQEVSHPSRSLQNVQQHSRLVEASSHRRDAAGDGPEGSEEENGQRGGEEELFDVEVNNGTLVMRGRDATRIFCGAVLLPTISALVGNLVFDDIKSNIRRTFYGGLLYIAVKGALKIYYKHQLCMRNQQRQILDYREQDHSSAS